MQYDANGVTIPNWTRNTAKVDSITITDHLNAYYLQFPSDTSAFGTNAGTIQDQTRGGNLLYAGSGSTSGMTALEKYSKLPMFEVYYMPPNYQSERVPVVQAAIPTSFKKVKHALDEYVAENGEHGRVVIEDKIPASLIFDPTSLIAYKTTGTYTSTLNSAFADAMLSPDAYELELGDDGSFKISFDVTEELQNAKYIAFYYRTGVADEHIRSKPPTSSA